MKTNIGALLLLILLLANQMCDAQSAGEKPTQPTFVFGLPTQTPQELAQFLKNKDPKIRRLAIVAIDRIKWNAGPIIPDLVKALGDSDTEVRAGAAECFSHFAYGPTPDFKQPNVKAAIPVLMKLVLKDPESAVRIAAACSLCNLPSQLAEKEVSLFQSLLNDHNKHVRLYAAGVVSWKTGDRKAYQIIGQTLGDADEKLSQIAVDLMIGLGYRNIDSNSAAFHTLQHELQNKNVRARQSAVFCIYRIFQALQTNKKRTPQEIISLTLKSLTDSDAYVVCSAIAALGEVGPAAKHSLPMLVKLLKHPHYWVRREAAENVGKFGRASKQTIPALIMALSDKEAVVRREVIETLASFRDEGKTVIAALIDANALYDPDTCAVAAQALASFGPEAKEAIPHVMKMLQHRDSHIREALAQELKHFGAPAKKAIPILTHMALGDPVNWVRRDALVTLGSFRDEGKTVIPTLLKTLHDNDPAVRGWAAKMLGEFGPEAKKAIPRIEELLMQEADANFHVWMAEALQKIKNK